MALKKSKKSAAKSSAAPPRALASTLPKDILLQPPPKKPHALTPLRIGAHLSTSGGVPNAIERAYRVGANTLQIFSSSPRMWSPYSITAEQAARTRALRQRYAIAPLVIHASYLVNCCSQSAEFRGKSVIALRGEVERALILGAEYLVLHPGSWRGLTRAEGLELAAESIEQALDGLPYHDANFRILIENTAGAEFSLGSKLDQVAELIERVRPVAPVAACLDTCHLHVSGYDIVSRESSAVTMQEIARTVGTSTIRVWHMNDAKAPRGSKLDRHTHIGEGTIGLDAFSRVLNDLRFSHCAFIAETPVDEPGDERRNIEAMQRLVR